VAVAAHRALRVGRLVTPDMRRTRTIDIHIGWLTIVAALIGITGLLIWAHAANQPPPDPAPHWPQVTRTIDGSTLVPMPEDIDRSTP